MSHSYVKYMLLLIVSGMVTGLDQISKHVVINQVRMYETIPVIPGFFNITHILNPGGAFGFMANQSSVVRSILFIAVSCLAICLLLYFFVQTPTSHKFLASGFALILGGAIGNLIDRLRFGKVVDFLDVYINGHHWPAFNIADSAVSIGIAIFLYHLVFKKLPIEEI